ncbi:MAG TPA: hypothetical protein VL443_21820 [Cyclobacteriaceae bacterium]|nr:hypothetical protein [Cyclobacteriaceae bacterium]
MQEKINPPLQQAVTETVKEVKEESNGLEAFSSKPDYANKSRFKTAPKTTVKLTDLLKIDPKKDQQADAADQAPALNEPFTPEQLQRVWNEFAEQRRIYQAEYQLLSQPYILKEKQITVTLHHPVQETMLNNLKSELTTFIREKLKNNFITLTSQLQVIDDKKVIYTSREKFEYLANKNPILNELKDRLMLDTDL